MLLFFIVFSDLSAADIWQTLEISRYHKSPQVFSIEDSKIINNIRKVTGNEAISAISGGKRVDILMFDIEGGRGVEPGDIIQFYSSRGVIGYTHTVSSSDIESGLRKEIDLSKSQKYNQITYYKQYDNQNFRNVAKMLESMNSYWKISGAQPFSISMRDGKVESAHNIPENIECTELATPNKTVYFKRSNSGKLEEVLVPKTFSDQINNKDWIIRFQDYNSLSSSEKIAANNQNLMRYMMEGAPPDTIGILFSDKDEARQINLRGHNREELLNKTYIFSEEKEDKGILSKSALESRESGLLSPDFLFNLKQYNPLGVGVEMNYDEDDQSITGIQTHDLSGSSLLGSVGSTSLIWCTVKPEPEPLPGQEILNTLNIGVVSTREGVRLTSLDWLDSEYAEEFLGKEGINTTLYFTRGALTQGYYKKVKGGDSFSTIYRDRGKIIRMELDESAIAQAVGSSRELLLNLKVVNEEYMGENMLFLNNIDAPDKKIWDNPPENVDGNKWKNGLLFPKDSAPEFNQSLVLRPPIKAFDERGEQIDLYDPDNNKWLVIKKKPKYPMLIAAGGFCYVILASFLVL